MPRQRCPYCGRWFKAAAGKGSQQVTCGAQACRGDHKRTLNRQWLEANPTCRQARYEKVRDRRRQEGYWGRYREDHPDYVARNRAQTRERMRELRAQRKEDAEVLAEPLKYLEGLAGSEAGLFATRELEGREDAGECSGIQAWPTVFATRELVAELSVGMWRYLKARERFATRERADGKAEGTL